MTQGDISSGNDLRAKPKLEIIVPLILFALFFAYLTLCIFKLPGQGDFDIHLAEIHALYLDSFHVRHESITDADSSALFFTPYHVFWAAVGKILRLHEYPLLQLAGMVNILFLFFASVYFFSACLPGPAKYGAALLFILISSLCRTKVYGWSSEASLSLLGPIASYPSVFARAAALFCFGCAIKFLARPRLFQASAIAFLVWFTLISHPLTASWMIVVLGTWAALTYGLPARRRSAPFFLAVTIVLGAVAVLAWPSVSFLVWGPISSLLPKLARIKEGTPFVGTPFAHIWPVYLLAALVACSGFAKKYFFIVSGFLASLLVFLAGWAVGIEHSSRYVFFMEVFPQILLALYLQRELATDKGRLRRLASLAATVLLLTGGGVLWSFEGVRSPLYLLNRPFADSSYFSRWLMLKPYLSNRDRVLILHPEWSPQVFAATSARSFAGRWASYMADGQERLLAQSQFFNIESDNRRRNEIIKRYHITRVIVTTERKDLLAVVKSLIGEPVFQDEFLTVFAVRT